MNAPAPLPTILDLGGRDYLVEQFHRYGTPRERWRVGAEFERAVVRPDGSPVGYAEPDGIRDILEALAARGWERRYENGALVALARPDGAHVTLEPGGQVELSGAPHASLCALHAEFDENRAALLALAEGRPLRWIACGLTPVAPVEAIDWMPKSRYTVMRDYLGRRGRLAHVMMKATASIQANFDYADEADCARKVQLAAGLAPLTTAIFANSPLQANRPTGFKSTRGHVWRHTDFDRTGVPPAVAAGYSHERWVDYLLDVPMMFVFRDGAHRPAHGLSFRAWMERGIDGDRPTVADWELHQTSVFPEVRVKRTIEVRGADCVSHDLALSFCALFTGLFYDEGALDEALALAADFGRHGSGEARMAEACLHGLEGRAGGRSLAEWARDLVAIAERGLRRRTEPERNLLQPLAERVDAARCPADDLLAAWTRDPSPEQVIRAVAY